jgi:prepilin-type N-terminal cleavage/methylation domain-containing protein
MHTTSIRTRRRSRGLTLIECLAATAVLAFGLLGVAGCLTAALLANQQASERELAVAIAQDTIEDMRSRGFGGVTAEAFPAASPVPELHSGSRAIAITDGYDGNWRLKHVQVTVSWRVPGGSVRRVAVETVIGNRAGH